MSTEVASMHARISAKMDEAINALKAVRNEFNTTGDAAERMETKVKKSESSLKVLADGFSAAQSKIFFFKENLETLGRVATEVFDAIKQGGVGLELKESFGQQIEDTGVALEHYLLKLREASGGTIADMDLMRSASKAMSLGVTQDVNEMADLLEIARFKARKFGTDTAVAFEDISVGVGRQSKLILDNLGIVVDTEQAYADYAAMLGTTASRLTEIEQKQAFLNAVLREGQAEIEAAGGMADSAADKYRRMETEISRAWDAMTQMMDRGLTRALDGATGGDGSNPVEGWVKEQEKNLLALQATQQAVIAAQADGDQAAAAGLAIASTLVQKGVKDWRYLEEAVQSNAAAQEAFRSVVLANADAFGLTQDEAIALAYGLTEAEVAAREMEDAIARVRQEAYMTAEQQRAQALATQQASDALIDNKNAALVNSYTQEEMALSMALARGEAASLVTQAAMLESGLYGVAGAARTAGNEIGMAFGRSEINAMRNKAGSPLFELESGNLGFGARNRLQGHQEEVQRTISLQNEMGRAATTAANTAEREAERAAKEAERAWENAVDNVRSAVSGAIDMSISVGANDEMLRSMGLQGEAVNEAGRRLEDVVNRGLESPWVEAFAELRGKTNDEVKATAAYMQQQIEQFLRPDLLNRDAILENARNALIGEKNRNALVEEITAQLVAEGYAVVEAKKQAAAQLGATIPDEGLEGGMQMVDAVVQSTRDTLASKEEELYQLGKATARPYLRGILDQTLESDLPNSIAQMVFMLIEQSSTQAGG